ncbi:MAG TPA: hypothetical protein PKY99_02610 [Turneriella sp.]|nr:hypothetical protein [Turneriella sp.]
MIAGSSLAGVRVWVPFGEVHFVNSQSPLAGNAGQPLDLFIHYSFAV